MSVAAWLLAIPQFIMAVVVFTMAIQNHGMAIDLRDKRPAISSRMAKRSAGAIFIIAAYIPATVGWLLEQPKGYIPSVSTVAQYVWDFCVFLCIYEWLKISSHAMTQEVEQKACRACPLRDEPYSTEECDKCL